MVEFLKDINGNDFRFEKGKHYPSNICHLGNDNDESIIIRQPNSPNNKNWWAKFPISELGKSLKIIKGTVEEQLEERRIFQL